MNFKKFPIFWPILSSSVLLVAFGAGILCAGGCNVFDPLDSPTSDAQLLSAARAYFDQGDFKTATEMYTKISGDRADDVNSDAAFQILDQNGASMGQFMIAFGTGGGSMGKGFTILANHLISAGGAAGKTKRLAILEAFQKVSLINDVSTRGMVRFTTATALVAELLAEGARPTGLVPTDIASGGDTCTHATVCATSNACEDTAGTFAIIESSLNFLPTSGTAKADGAKPDYYLMAAALREIDRALSQEIKAGGALGGKMTGLMSDLINNFAASLGTVPRCSRQALLSQGIGY